MAASVLTSLRTQGSRQRQAVLMERVCRNDTSYFNAGFIPFCEMMYIKEKCRHQNRSGLCLKRMEGVKEQLVEEREKRGD